jgi:hypothetical protein
MVQGGSFYCDRTLRGTIWLWLYIRYMAMYSGYNPIYNNMALYAIFVLVYTI